MRGLLGILVKRRKIVAILAIGGVVHLLWDHEGGDVPSVMRSVFVVLLLALAAWALWPEVAEDLAELKKPQSALRDVHGNEIARRRKFRPALILTLILLMFAGLIFWSGYKFHAAEPTAVAETEKYKQERDDALDLLQRKDAELQAERARVPSNVDLSPTVRMLSQRVDEEHEKRVKVEDALHSIQWTVTALDAYDSAYVELKKQKPRSSESEMVILTAMGMMADRGKRLPKDAESARKWGIEFEAELDVISGKIRPVISGVELSPSEPGPEFRRHGYPGEIDRNDGRRRDRLEFFEQKLAAKLEEIRKLDAMQAETTKHLGHLDLAIQQKYRQLIDPTIQRSNRAKYIENRLGAAIALLHGQFEIHIADPREFEDWMHSTAHAKSLIESDLRGLGIKEDETALKYFIYSPLVQNGERIEHALDSRHNEHLQRLRATIEAMKKELQGRREGEG